MIDAKIENIVQVNWIITLKNDSKLIGKIGFYRIQPVYFRAEIGFKLLLSLVLAESIQKL